MIASKFLNPTETQIVIDAITEAELKTSGEIRVHLDNFCFGNEIKVAQKVFTRLNMHRTRERNGVLIYIATVSRKIAIIGDEGIHAKLGHEYWQKLVDGVIQKFRNGERAAALAACVLECGDQLGKFFPRAEDDKDELSNSISYK